MKRTIGVNLLYLVPGVVGGTEEYAVRMLRAVAAHREDDLELVLFARDSFADAYPDIAGVFATKTVALPANRVLRVAAESTWLARQPRRRRHASSRRTGAGVRFGAVGGHRARPATVAVPRRVLRGQASVPGLFAAAIGAQSAGRRVGQRVGAAVDHRDVAHPRRTHGRGVGAVRTARSGRSRHRRASGGACRSRCAASRRQAIRSSCIPRSPTRTRTIAPSSKRSPLARSHDSARLVLTGGPGPLEREITELIDRLHARRSRRAHRSDRTRATRHHARARARARLPLDLRRVRPARSSRRCASVAPRSSPTRLRFPKRSAARVFSSTPCRSRRGATRSRRRSPGTHRVANSSSPRVPSGSNSCCRRGWRLGGSSCTVDCGDRSFAS